MKLFAGMKMSSTSSSSSRGMTTIDCSPSPIKRFGGGDCGGGGDVGGGADAGGSGGGGGFGGDDDKLGGG